MLAKRHRAVRPGGSTALALLPAKPASGAAESAALHAARAAIAS
ncbi:putative secreted protein [Candidatus Protofrankia californiensis]|uniref:Putative secreted protein n=1 Tax=Candidatus Protofrankia californiensis TaxID=1839754 RepID=A0A1C3NYK6_9ACTN|nr:putative secreted protein [Candidatus Protofrankia californiensis]